MLDRFAKIIDVLCSSSDESKNESLERLEELRKRIISLYEDGTIRERNFKVLNDKISESRKENDQ